MVVMVMKVASYCWQQYCQSWYLEEKGPGLFTTKLLQYITVSQTLTCSLIHLGKKPSRQQVDSTSMSVNLGCLADLGHYLRLMVWGGIHTSNNIYRNLRNECVNMNKTVEYL